MHAPTPEQTTAVELLVRAQPNTTVTQYLPILITRKVRAVLGNMDGVRLESVDEHNTKAYILRITEATQEQARAVADALEKVFTLSDPPSGFEKEAVPREPTASA